MLQHTHLQCECTSKWIHFNFFVSQGVGGQRRVFDKLRKRGMSRIEPALLILDGHGSQLQRELMVALRCICYIVVM